MEMRVFEKNGRLWFTMTDRTGDTIDVPSRVEIVKDDSIEAFGKFLSQPGVEKAMLDCKESQEKRRPE